MERNVTEMKRAGDRITVIDALRGFALLGVVLVHMQQHYGIFNFGGQASSEAMFPAADEWIGWLTSNVLMGRFINIFAFLFGMSFFIQMDRAARKGVDFRKRFVWRMAVLFFIGVAGSAFYMGDILSIYAAFGLILVLLYPLKNKALLIVACVFLAGTPRWIQLGYDKWETARQTEVAAAPVQAPAREVPPASDADGGSADNAAVAVAERRRGPATAQTPSFWSSVKNNLTEGRLRTLRYQFGMSGRGYLTFALFILGLVVGRIRFFETVHLHKRRNVTLFAAFALVTAALEAAGGMLPQGVGGFMRGAPSALSVLGMTLNDLSMVAMSAAVAMGFVVLYHMKGVGRALDILSPYGRMGLTNYEMQGVVGSILFSLWGFGAVFGRWHAAELFCLGLAVYAVQIVFSKMWLGYFKYGPLEWLWRSATYLKVQPFRK